jgi:hypothetical protein
MKIALCLSGQARSFKQGFEYYKKNLLDHYDVDVFIHTWEFDEWKEYVDLYNPVEFKMDQSVTGDYGKTIDEMYIRTPNKEKFPPRFTYAMLHSMDTCATMLSKHVFTAHKKYDWVVRSRSDYALNVKIPFAELDNSKLHIPNCRMVPERDFGNDQFAFSSLKNMLKYMSTYRMMDHYYTDLNATYIGENLMQSNLHQHSLHGENLVYVDMNNPFPPGKHNGTWHSLIRDDYEQWTAKS